ncbi:MAG: HAMP domain-containing protein [Oxalobacter sp.]|nr:MAG: HAMP domain-containing protein [Oxalobacter sp.]
MRFKKRHSLTFRLTLLFATASTAVLLALGYLIGHSVEKHFDELDMAQLVGKLTFTQNLLSKMNNGEHVLASPKNLDDALAAHHEPTVSISVFDLNRNRIWGTVDHTFPPSLFETARDDKPGKMIVWEKDGMTYRSVAARVTTSAPEWPSIFVVVSMDTSHHQHFMTGFTLTLWGFVAFSALLTGLLGWASARRGLAPLRKMKQNVAEVSAHRLDQHIAADSFPSELAELSETFNGMLVRLENSFNRLSDFSSDIAHELRTPVSNLMMQTQVALTKARTADEYRDILVSNAEDLERMARMIADMLFLAQSENGLLVISQESVSLEKEFRELFEFYEALSEEKSIQLRLTGAADIPGDRLMLRRAFSNLLSNAIRHAPPGETVQVTITCPDQNTVQVEVSNPGSISEEHLPRLFDRFYRIDPSRHRAGEGTGLGLAITKSIIEAHSGTIKIESHNGTVYVVVCFPKTLV